MNILRTIPLWLAVLCLFGTAAGSTAKAQPYDALYAFGDSLTDTWREPSESPLHWRGRWSNGPLWVEQLSTNLGLVYEPLNNYAHSGARADDTFGQIRDDFLPTNSISNSLCVVWAGGNDFIQTWDNNLWDDSKWTAMIRYGVSNLSNCVTALRDRGARTIFVPNTVNVARIPIIYQATIGLFRDYLGDKVKQWNAELKTALDALQAANPQLRILTADTFELLREILHEDESFGFTETKWGAVDDVTLLDKSFDGPGANYLFWDPIHPSSKAHGIIADRFLMAVARRAPQVAAPAPSVGGSFTLMVTNLHLGRGYSVQRSVDFVNWTNVGSNMNYTSRVQAFTVTNNLPVALYRVWFQP